MLKKVFFLSLAAIFCVECKKEQLPLSSKNNTSSEIEWGIQGDYFIIISPDAERIDTIIIPGTWGRSDDGQLALYLSSS